MMAKENRDFGPSGTGGLSGSTLKVNSNEQSHSSESSKMLRDASEKPTGIKY